MILGMPVETFTLWHVLISLVGIYSGFIVLIKMMKARSSRGWTAVFLITTILTSVTGFFFHSKAFGPPHVVGVISLIILAMALLALRMHLAGKWRATYVITATAALYLNVFVGVVQAFDKIPLLHKAAPAQSDPPFILAQLIVLTAFVLWGRSAVKKFQPQGAA